MQGSNLKVGDKVRYKLDGRTAPLRGLEGVIIVIHNSTCALEITKTNANRQWSVGHTIYPVLDNLELIEEEKEELAKNSFAVGDIVSYNYSAAWQGGRGRIINVNSDDSYLVESIEIPEGAKDTYPEGDTSSWKGEHLRLLPEVEDEEEAAELAQLAELREAVQHPAHYGGDTTYEVIKVAEAWGLDKDAYLFNVVKYVGRAGKKSKATLLEDLKKARFYLDRRIRALEEALQ